MPLTGLGKLVNSAAHASGWAGLRSIQNAPKDSVNSLEAWAPRGTYGHGTCYCSIYGVPVIVFVGPVGGVLYVNKAPFVKRNRIPPKRAITFV